MQGTRTIRLLSLALLLTAVFFVFSGIGRGQSIFRVPERLRLNGIGEPDPNEEGHMGVITGAFYPIGWSKDGKFAYLFEPPDEDCGCYFAEVVIQDLRSDKIVWKERYSNANAPEPTEEDRNTLWKKKGAEYTARFREQGIEQLDSFMLLHPSINFEGDVLTPKIDIRIKTDGNFMVDGTVTVSMTSRKHGSKVVHRDIYRRRDTNGFRDAEISGSLVSPFEPRAAIVIVEVVRGWEGPPNVMQIKIAGSTLARGFRK